MVEIPFDFIPVSGENIRAYHIADAHNRIEEPIAAVHTYEKEYGKIDFLIFRIISLLITFGKCRENSTYLHFHPL